MAFEIGQTVVYPHHGAATIEDIAIRTIRGEDRTYLTLRVNQGDLTIQVPAENVDLVGVRDVVDEDGLDHVLSVLRAEYIEEPTNWSRRFKANQEKIATGDIIKVAEVVRDLTRRDDEKKLSTGEKRMLVKARNILISELALARNISKPAAAERLDSVLAEGRIIPVEGAVSEPEEIDEELDASVTEDDPPLPGSSSMKQAPVFAVLTAAGSGTRLGENIPKALVCLLDHPMLTYAAQGLIEAGVAGVVVTAPESHIEECAHALDLAQSQRKKTDPAADRLEKRTHTIPVTVVPGGSTRQASVAAGLAAIPNLAAQLGHVPTDETVVLIHDAARALTPIDAIQRVIDAVRSGSKAVIPTLPVTDTLKVIDRSTAGEHLIGSVSDTVDRSALVAVQTPQGFTWTAISQAHNAGTELAVDETLAATDDAGLIEALGGRVDIVLGDSLAMKITTPWDLRIARLILRDTHPNVPKEL